MSKSIPDSPKQLARNAARVVPIGTPLTVQTTTICFRCGKVIPMTAKAEFFLGKGISHIKGECS